MNKEQASVEQCLYKILTAARTEGYGIVTDVKHPLDVSHSPKLMALAIVGKYVAGFFEQPWGYSVQRMILAGDRAYAANSLMPFLTEGGGALPGRMALPFSENNSGSQVMGSLDGWNAESSRTTERAFFINAQLIAAGADLSHNGHTVYDVMSSIVSHNGNTVRSAAGKRIKIDALAMMNHNLIGAVDATPNNHMMVLGFTNDGADVDVTGILSKGYGVFDVEKYGSLEKAIAQFNDDRNLLQPERVDSYVFLDKPKANPFAPEHDACGLTLETVRIQNGYIAQLIAQTEAHLVWLKHQQQKFNELELTLAAQAADAITNHKEKE